MSFSMTENEIIDGLLARDGRITRDFFFSDGPKSCKPLLLSIIGYVFPYAVDYDEAVNEFYAYLLENDGTRLRQIQDRNTLFGWLKVCATRYFIKRRDYLIENRSREPLFTKVAPNHLDDLQRPADARSDMQRILLGMKNQRYAYVLRMLIIQDVEPELLAREMGITAANLYNIKKRAIVEFTKVALKDVNLYGKK